MEMGRGFEREHGRWLERHLGARKGERLDVLKRGMSWMYSRFMPIINIQYIPYNPQQYNAARDQVNGEKLLLRRGCMEKETVSW